MAVMNIGWLGLRFTFLLLAVLSTLIAAILTQRFNQRHDPFSPYGWVISAGANALTCQDRSSPDVDRNVTAVGQLCSLYPRTGPFGQISIVRGEEVYPVYFTVRDGALTVGDLAAWWGRPEVGPAYRGQVNLHWSAQGVAATALSCSGRFSYLLPLQRVIFTGNSS